MSATWRRRIIVFGLALVGLAVTAHTASADEEPTKWEQLSFPTRRSAVPGAFSATLRSRAAWFPGCPQSISPTKQSLPARRAAATSSCKHPTGMHLSTFLHEVRVLSL